jgi:hypothetical protein
MERYLSKISRSNREVFNAGAMNFKAVARKKLPMQNQPRKYLKCNKTTQIKPGRTNFCPYHPKPIASHGNLVLILSAPFFSPTVYVAT